MRETTSDLLGSKVGHIRVIDVLGEGGMGAVYVGFDDTLQRKVALKAIRAEFRLDAQARARFLREARILSQLGHSSVCTVFDYIGGEDVDFLVMELIDGRSLRQAMGTGLGGDEKLSIARQLLEVLVAVHGEGVVHRDLKPENVMVTSAGQIKVLDFGLSQSVADQMVSSAVQTLAHGDVGDGGEPDRAAAVRGGLPLRTSAGTVVGTLGYMSPEQARGEPATAASDMYSLGLILQELWTGQSPYEPGLTPAALLEKAARGEASPVEGLQGDLTGLINRLKAFSPGARPSSVDALEHLEQIIDRPRRRRRRALVAVIWVVLFILSSALAVQSLRATREAHRAQEMATASELEAERAEQVASYLIDLFRVDDPRASLGRVVTAQEILGRGGEWIDELDDQPEVQARLARALASSYANLGECAEAVPLIDLALEIDQRLYDDLGVVENTMLDVQAVCFYRRDYPEAESILRKLVAIEEAEPEADESFLASLRSSVGLALASQGRAEEAEALYRSALADLEEANGPEDPEVAWVLGHLGQLLAAQGHSAEGAAMCERALAIREARFGPDDPATAESLELLAFVRRAQGELSEAESLLRRAMAILGADVGLENPLAAPCQENLAAVLWEQGRPAEAEILYRRVLGVYGRTLGLRHTTVKPVVAEFAELLRATHRTAEAKELERQIE